MIIIYWLVIDMVSERNYLPKQLYTLLNNVLSSFDRRNLVGGLFCHLQKAFDCVNHEILRAKMKFYGISVIANKFNGILFRK